jgi:Autophagocytosis associated protein, active-site domain
MGHRACRQRRRGFRRAAESRHFDQGSDSKTRRETGCGAVDVRQPRGSRVDWPLFVSLHADGSVWCGPQEHPVYGEPYYFLHPCRTGDRLAVMVPVTQETTALQWLLAWWSFVAPVFQIPLRPAAWARALQLSTGSNGVPMSDS